MRGEVGGRMLTFSVFFMCWMPFRVRSEVSHLALSTLLVHSDFYRHFAEEETDEMTGPAQQSCQG